MSEILQVPVEKPTGRKSRKHRFSILPVDVLKRKDITASCKLVLSVMDMESYGTGVVFFSQTQTGERCGVSRSQVIACQKRLEAVELIEKFGKPRDQVQGYRLLHPDMAAAKRGSAEKADRCRSCGVSRPTDNFSVCVPCRQYDAAKVEIGKIFQERGLCEWHEMWSILKSLSFKGASRTIRRAYIAAFDEARGKAQTA